MIEIKILPIDRLLELPYLGSTFRVGIMFITMNPHYYNFGLTPFQIIRMEDGDGSDINKIHLRDILNFADRCVDVDTIYVCCDAGISRSPAIAKFIAEYLHLDNQAKEIEEKYKYLNVDIYNKLKELCKDE